jgi:hypothetical protein
MRRQRLALALFIIAMLPRWAQADPSRDDVFAAILAEDAATVRAALAGTTPAAQRAAFSAFVTVHPKADQMSQALLTATPDDAGALTARGWYLFDLAGTRRGNGTASWPSPRRTKACRSPTAG